MTKTAKARTNKKKLVAEKLAPPAPPAPPQEYGLTQALVELCAGYAEDAAHQEVLEDQLAELDQQLENTRNAINDELDAIYGVFGLEMSDIECEESPISVCVLETPESNIIGRRCYFCGLHEEEM
jgi:hypothetical protein